MAEYVLEDDLRIIMYAALAYRKEEAKARIHDAFNSLKEDNDALRGALLFEKTMKERARQEREALSKAVALLNWVHDRMVAENKARRDY